MVCDSSLCNSRPRRVFTRPARVAEEKGGKRDGCEEKSGQFIVIVSRVCARWKAQQMQWCRREAPRHLGGDATWTTEMSARMRVTPLLPLRCTSLSPQTRGMPRILT